ncbi:unnamed protein product [Lactuca saligna]|uniref:Uncharacterized protein n=1 Tax=Lactuca saligna TaxID=75948 RepID=A0AA35ZUX9_LACSI|nr:unnamed protein product [Lactuca saligna]
MITGSHRSYFGDIITKWFHRVIGIRTCGAIRYGGLITVIARSLTEQSPPGYTFFSADSFRLTLQNLRAMHMLRTTPGGYVWMRGRSTYFKVIGPDVIALADPISNTMWVLPSNIPPPPSIRRAQQVRHPPSDRPCSSTQHPDYADATPVSFRQPDPMQTDY